VTDGLAGVEHFVVGSVVVAEHFVVGLLLDGLVEMWDLVDDGLFDLDGVVVAGWIVIVTAAVVKNRLCSGQTWERLEKVAAAEFLEMNRFLIKKIFMFFHRLH